VGPGQDHRGRSRAAARARVQRLRTVHVDADRLARWAAGFAANHGPIRAEAPAGPSKVGTRYVQGRTAAGGWSQQRFARRRDNQTADLVGTAAEHALRLLVPALPVDGLVTGGDAPLIERLLADPRLGPLAALPVVAHLAVGDPRSDVLRDVPVQVRKVRIDLVDP
jgi:hypothetical protein